MNEVLPAADRPWSIERHGIEAIPESDRRGTAAELFWVWFAANIGILGLVYGGILAAADLNLWQGALVAFVGSAGSFVLVGVLSIPGGGGASRSGCCPRHRSVREEIWDRRC